MKFSTQAQFKLRFHQAQVGPPVAKRLQFQEVGFLILPLPIRHTMASITNGQKPQQILPIKQGMKMQS